MEGLSGANARNGNSHLGQRSDVTDHCPEFYQLMPVEATHERVSEVIFINPQGDSFQDSSHYDASNVDRTNEQIDLPKYDDVQQVTNYYGGYEDWEQNIEHNVPVDTRNLTGIYQFFPVAVSSEESQNLVVNNGQTLSRKRRGSDYEEESQFDRNLQQDVALCNVRGACGRNVSRRTFEYGQASGSSSPLNQIAACYPFPISGKSFDYGQASGSSSPLNQIAASYPLPISGISFDYGQASGSSCPVNQMALNYNWHDGNAQPFDIVGQVAASLQLGANDGRTVGNLQMGTVDHSQASFNHPIPVNYLALGHSESSGSGEVLHAIGQITAGAGSRENSRGGAFGVASVTGILSMIAHHMEVFCQLSPDQQAVVLSSPSSGGVLSNFARHIRAFSLLPPHGQASVLTAMDGSNHEMYPALILIQSLQGSEILDMDQMNNRGWYAALWRELEDDFMRLDVRRMTYEMMRFMMEQILALQERFGRVDTGLSERAILSHVNQYKHPVSRLDPRVATETCTVCLDDFEKGQIIGKLGCGHKYHFQCVKTWLLQKNSCPMCKAPAVAPIPPISFP